MCEASPQIQAVFAFVEPVLQLFLAQGVAEGAQIRELANRAGIELIDAGEGLLTDGLLVVGEEQTSELGALEEVLAVVVGFGHGEHILVHIRVILPVVVEFEAQARWGRHAEGLLSIERLCRVKRLVMTLDAVAKVAHFLDSDIALVMLRLIVDVLGALNS